jgi:hypothetical protein
MSFVSNEEYLERWEATRPEAVANTLTPEEIAAHQNSRHREDPLTAYDWEMADHFSADLAADIAEYAKRVDDHTDDSTKEELARRKEENAASVVEYQWVTPEEYADAGARKGRIMHSSTFINKLRSSGLNCWYRYHAQPGKITLVYQVTPMKTDVGCWVQFGFMPELSIMDFDEHGVPLAEKYRGWRTPLLQLILKGAISEREADRIFGRPKVTEQFHRYNSLLQSFRNAGGSLGKKED